MLEHVRSRNAFLAGVQNIMFALIMGVFGSVIPKCYSIHSTQSKCDPIVILQTPDVIVQ